MQARNRNNITTNVFDLDPTPFHKERLAYMKERGPGCFDAAYYASQDENYDVHVSFSPLLASLITAWQQLGELLEPEAPALPAIMAGCSQCRAACAVFAGKAASMADTAAAPLQEHGPCAWCLSRGSQSCS